MNSFLARCLACVLDPTILFSFDRTGFRLHSAAFDPEDLRVDLGGQTCLITGANSGIGLEIARTLARLGAQVGLLCRSPERGRQAIEELQGAVPGASLFVEQLDVSDPASVRSLASRLQADRVDVLVHNAGVLQAQRQTSSEGIELTFATHVTGPFLLTRLLQERLQRSACSRVITVSSGGMYPVRLELLDWNWEQRPYDGVRAYAETKRAQVVLNELWAEHAGPGCVHFHCMHPGWADTPAVRTSIPRFWSVMRDRLRTPAEGADTVIWLAASRAGQESSGRFWFDRRARRTCLLPFTRESATERERLWDLCEKLCSR